MESRWPLFAFGRDRAHHALPNLALATLAIAMNVGFAWALAGGSSGWAPIHGSPFWLQLVFGLAVLDLATWLAHRTMHALPWMWRFHRVHHADATVDVTTAFRQHPGETLWRLA
jgi:sterol desaturase/sphingolipid hydroxylase (fatty acid hydroxylase superfamily)